jgi:hypothetical protein
MLPVCTATMPPRKFSSLPVVTCTSDTADMAAAVTISASMARRRACHDTIRLAARTQMNVAFTNSEKRPSTARRFRAQTPLA